MKGASEAPPTNSAGNGSAMVTLDTASKPKLSKWPYDRAVEVTVIYPEGRKALNVQELAEHQRGFGRNLLGLSAIILASRPSDFPPAFSRRD